MTNEHHTHETRGVRRTTATADPAGLRADGGANGATRAADAASQPPVVVKIGGARAVDPAGAIDDVATLVEAGRDVVVVHGGSTAVDDTLEALGEEPTYVETPGGVVGRFTDERTMEVFSMVLPGQLNTELTTALRGAGVDALGLSGVDGGLLTGPRKSAVRVLEDGKRKIKRGDHSGKITDVNAGLLETLLGDGYTPVVTVPMLAADGVAVNADADRAAAAVAGAIGAELVVLTDVEGVYADPDDPSTLIGSVETDEEFDGLKGAADGFMRKKVMAAEEALNAGAPTVVVASANADAPLTAALGGSGTRIDASAVATDAEPTDAASADDSTESTDGDDTEASG
jgi:acetylglutamate/LysW-gamma-L-alpha-aminoadipate kinase